MKLIDKIDAATKEGKTFFSFEFFPPKTDEGVQNLFDRMDRMVSYGPAFCDITWGAGGSTADLTLDIANRMQNEINIESMMHLTCTNMPVTELKKALDALKSFGVQNILALRGDPPHGAETFEAVDGGFSCALDLVKYIRAETGDHFGIGVSGYPEAHPDVIVEDKEQMVKNYWNDINYLKEKLDAGADFVVTQLFYDVDIFIKWVADCRSVGITKPIIPGIMPIMAYGGFTRMTSFCKTYVPQAVKDKIESLKDDDAGLKEYGIQLGVEMCQKILDAKVSPGVHMYSLNQDKSAVAILERLGVCDTKSTGALPFRVRTRAPMEAVRPVFWANRPKSYVARTAHWDALPQHSWTEASGCEFAVPTQFMDKNSKSEKKSATALAKWGSPETVADVQAMFSSFLQEGGVFPWMEAGLTPAAATLTNQLTKLVQSRHLPVNVLPQVNAKASTDPTHGWGPAGGYVYQKGYVEFFCSPDDFKSLVRHVQTFSSVSYMAVNSSGDFHSDLPATSAMSWGVFPGQEVAQPLVACPQAFQAWKDEAFGLWTSEWGALLDAGCKGAALLQEIKDTWFLVGLVENDYVGGDVFRVFA